MAGTWTSGESPESPDSISAFSNLSSSPILPVLPATKFQTYFPVTVEMLSSNKTKHCSWSNTWRTLGLWSAIQNSCATCAIRPRSYLCDGNKWYPFVKNLMNEGENNPIPPKLSRHILQSAERKTHSNEWKIWRARSYDLKRRMHSKKNCIFQKEWVDLNAIFTGRKPNMMES